MKKDNFCVSLFTDNAGAIEFNQDWLVCHKVETHNTPSALDPFGGSITGIVGVNRDCLGFGKGAKPIANTYAYYLANPNKNYYLYIILINLFISLNIFLFEKSVKKI